MTTSEIHWSAPAELTRAIDASLARAVADRWIERLWSRDATLWTGGDEARWLGWLDVAARERSRTGELRDFADAVRSEGVDDVLLLGMGGSSLAPEVLWTVFGRRPGYPRLRILDSTNPAQVRAAITAGRLDRTLVVVASKSGSTLEPHVFLETFWERLQDGRRFVAITDPGSKLETLARERNFRAIYHGEPEIGGRYSALSRFGLVPASLIGADLDALLDGALAMAASCRSPSAPSAPSARSDAGENPGLLLGVVMGAAALAGRDKLTLTTSPALWDVGAWIEQLVAESTGKRGRAVIPVDGEPLGPPERYGADRLFVSLELDGDENPENLLALARLAETGSPVVRLKMPSRAALGGEFFRWEFATAVAGAVLGIHPFDQPDVEASKVETRALTDQVERDGALPAESPFFSAEGLRFYADERNAEQLTGATAIADAADLLARQLKRALPGDYFALLAYLEMRGEVRDTLETMRQAARDARRVATCLGFGPRFLHSTGQAYKGGPDSGVFLQITSEHPADLAIPGRRATFGAVQSAQARGDFAVLAQRGRRALRVHLDDPGAGLTRLSAAFTEALRRV